MKRLLALLLALSLLTAMAGCGEAEESSAPAKNTTTTTTTASTTTTTTRQPLAISTMQGQTTTFASYTVKTTTQTAATTTTTKAPMVADPIMDTPYECWITSGTDLIVASVTFTTEGCVIARTFYTCDPAHKVYGTNTDKVDHQGETYYKTTYAPQSAARYEVVGIRIEVYNTDGSVTKTFVMTESTSMECSYSDGIAFGRNNNFVLSKK